MPDDLRAQVEPMMEIVEALGFPILRVDGVEADDVIGTLALQGARGRHRRSPSPPATRTSRSWCAPGVTLVNTMSGSELDSDAAVIEKFGVRADQIVDYLALMGDSVDNIPGVRQMRAEDRGEVAGRIRHAGRRDRQCRQDRRQDRREPARSACRGCR